MDVIAQLVAMLGFEFDDSSEGNRRRFDKGLADSRKNLANFAKDATKFAAGIATAAMAAAGALFKFVGPVAQEFDQLANQAQRLGVGVEALQELRYAAEQAGIGIQNFDVALRRFIRRSSEAAKGTGAAKDAFKELGIHLKDNQGNLKASEDLLGEVADAIMKTENQADRLRLAFRFFETDGAAMVQMLESGSEGLQRFYQEARDLGLVMGEDNVKAAQDYTAQLTRLQRIIQSIRSQVALNLLPVMTRWMRGWQDWIRANRELIQMNIDRALQWTTRAIESVGSAAVSAGRSVQWLSQQITGLTGLSGTDQAAALGAGAVAWLASRHPILAALAAAFLLLEDFQGYRDGKKSLIGDFLNELDKIQQRIDEFRAGKEVEAGVPLIPKTWFEQLVEFDEALMRTFGLKPGDLDISQLWGGWNLTDNVLAPMWTEFEAWWDRLVQGFHDVGSRAGQALLAGLRDALVPDWLRSTSEAYQERLLGAEAGAAVGAMVPARTSGKGGRLVPSEPDPARFGPAFMPAPADGVEGLREILGAVKGGLDLIGSGIEKFAPGPVDNSRSIDFDQSNSVTINQNVTGATAPGAAASAVEGALDRAGRRAADIAAQGPSLE